MERVFRHAARVRGTGLWLGLWLFTWFGLEARATQAAAAPEPRVGLVGLHAGVADQLAEQADSVGVDLVRLDAELDGDAALDWSGLDLVCVQHLDSVRGRRLTRAVKRAGPSLRVLSLSGLAEAELPELMVDDRVLTDPRATAYYAGGGSKNLLHLLRLVRSIATGTEIDLPAPEPRPEQALWHPARAEPFVTLEEFLAWDRSRAGLPARDRGRAVVTAHHLHRVAQQPAVVAALVDALERRGLTTLVLQDYAPDATQVLRSFEPDVVVHTCHSPDDVELRLALDAPHLTSVFERGFDPDQWRASPTGLEPGTVGFQITSQELLGAIEPIICATLPEGGSDGAAFAPLPEGVELLADRAAAWTALRRKAPAQKRVAILYYNREMGGGDVLRGSATGMFLNGPRSLLAVLRRLAEEGYAIDELPADEQELLDELVDHGRQIGAWDPEALDRLARSGHAALIPAERYREWFEREVPDYRRRELVERWGPPPGRIQVWRDDEGREHLVCPTVAVGDGVVLLPQPLRGEAHDVSLAHDRSIPPSHNYLATYLWLREEYGADALVHFGTHGTEFLLPGKAAGHAADDWGSLLIGHLPNITPWVINNLGESSPARRRAFAVLVDHLVPPSATAPLSDELELLHTDADRFEQLADGALRERYRAAVSERVATSGLDVELELSRADGLLDDPSIAAVSEFLHRLSEETRPRALHTFGQAPDPELVLSYLVTCLGADFVERVAALAGPRLGVDPAHADAAARLLAVGLLRDVLRGGRELGAALLDLGRPEPHDVEAFRDALELARRIESGLAGAGSELDGLVRALEGRFVPPGPGNSPDRNPDVLPTGRNMTLLDPEQVPSRPSWELGRELAEALLGRERERLGRWPERVGFTLSSFATFQDFGVMESQILALLGVRPIWDARGRVTDVELVPLAELGRPRIDVFIAAGTYYRDLLPSRMRLIDRAVRLVADAEGEGMSIARNDARVRERLLAAGIAPQQAETLARARIFGYAPGSMGSSGYYYLVERSGEWDTREELVDTYLEHVGFAYTDGAWGVEAHDAYAAQIQGTDTVVRTWADRTRSPSSNKYDWYHGGSLSLAVESLTGTRPEYLFTDVRDPDRAELIDARTAFLRDARLRVLSSSWLDDMRAEGYAGADQVAVHAKNFMGWEIMRSGTVPTETWERLVEIYVRDAFDVGVVEWFEEVNPHAYRDVLATLLESARKGYFDASEATRRELAREWRRTELPDDPGGMLEGGNVGLEAFVEELLADGDEAEVLAAPVEPELPPLSEEPPKAAEQATLPPEVASIEGRVLEPAPTAAEEASSWWWLGIPIGLVIAGFLFRIDGERPTAVGRR